MDFELPEELRLLREAAARFTTRELFPHEPLVIRREAERGYTDMPLLPPELEKEILAKARTAGLVGLEVPEGYGGAGASMLAKCVVTEQLKHSILFPFGFPPNFPDVFMLLESCKGGQIDKYLKPFLRGETQSCIAITEPGAGADASAIQMRAQRQNGKWVLNGTKIFITHARYADFMIVVTVTDPAKGARGGMTTFLLDAKQRGISVPSAYPMIGDYQPYEVRFDNVEASDDQVLGEVGQAFVPLQGRLGLRRMEIAATCVGLASRCLKMMIEQAKLRKTFGAPLAERQAVQWWIADSYREIELTRLALYKLAWDLDQKNDTRRDASMVKVQATEMVAAVVDRAMQLFGGMGMSKALPLEFISRVTRIYRIVEGPSEVHRWVVARDLLKNGLPY
ncbi:MAG: acyl-CoA dehydrogenase family protein [Betaproteobacteria bacterium]|nr:acyl-CoA dehydrogenase family protein [Betaproteobacteria bacterium]